MYCIYVSYSCAFCPKLLCSICTSGVGGKSDRTPTFDWSIPRSDWVSMPSLVQCSP